MTPTGIQIKVVQDRLGLLDRSLRDLRSLPASSLEEFLGDSRNPAAAESCLRRGIEALIDVARHILAKGLGIASLEYAEVARRAVEHGLIEDRTLGEAFGKIAKYRNRMAHYYDEISNDELYGIILHHLGDLEGLAAEFRRAAGRLNKAV
ncbi:MAG TPA: DUF86 domain-containing protein [Thermoanaerobaculia bacterium]|jgi:uncharacterized protein YutE (UPF0331/DUF86 family)|nr:DUF86 domain-containing protein [Thermoanaerobaculia bacterium]